MRTVLLCVALGLASCLVLPAADKPPDAAPPPQAPNEANGIWVGLELGDQGGRTECMGLMDKRVFQAIVDGTYDPKKFVRLEHVFWFDDDGKFIRQDEWGEKPVYSASLYARPDTITRIVPLDPARMDKVKKELLRPSRPPQRPGGMDRGNGIEI